MDRRHFLAAVAAAPLLAARHERVSAAGPDAAATVTALVRETRRRYHDASRGAAIANRLAAAHRAGRFGGADTAEALAERLNAEIRAASNDLHFVVMPGAMHAPDVAPTPAHSPPPPFTTGELAVLRRRNCGLAAAELLAGNVGRLDVRLLYRPAAEVRARLASAMTFLADSWALIVDLSQCPGGDAHAVALLLSYFFERPPFVVNRFRWRDRPVEEFRTTAEPGGPLYGEARPLVVLVSASTYSAAEELAYDVQALGRGAIVGEVTGGAANHAIAAPIAGGFTAFIPEARAENPVTGGNWEGVGVRPDVPAAADALARTGHRIALQRVAAGGDAERARIARDALDRLQA